MESPFSKGDPKISSTTDYYFKPILKLNTVHHKDYIRSLRFATIQKIPYKLGVIDR